MTKVTKENRRHYRQKWLDFLRGEGRRKAKGLLEKIAGYDKENPRCCLGHACVALGMKGVKDNTNMIYDGSSALLPLSAQIQLGISSDGSFKECVSVGSATYSSLSTINDCTDLSPADIADVIEEQFKNDNFEEFPTLL